MSQIPPPEKEVLKTLLGLQKYKLWQLICDFAHQSYAPILKWYTGGKAGVYELKFQKGGKSVFSVFAKENGVCLMVIFGAEQRAVFKGHSDEVAPFIRTVYDKAPTYHDGKWMMFDIQNEHEFDQIKKMIVIKKKPLV